MAFTRFHDDPARIAKRLEESTFAGNYQLNKPGPGVDLPFQEDPSQRLQQWGANLRTNTIALEGDLPRRLTKKDHLQENNYKTHQVMTQPMASWSNAQPFVEESRASHPAWMYRGCDQTRWETPLIDPQEYVAIPFVHNIQTRILEKNK
jgi:hypothetical protein